MVAFCCDGPVSELQPAWQRATTDAIRWWDGDDKNYHCRMLGWRGGELQPAPQKAVIGHVFRCKRCWRHRPRVLEPTSFDAGSGDTRSDWNATTMVTMCWNRPAAELQPLATEAGTFGGRAAIPGGNAMGAIRWQCSRGAMVLQPERGGVCELLHQRMKDGKANSARDGAGATWFCLDQTAIRGSV